MNAINTLYRRSVPSGLPQPVLPPRSPSDTTAVLRQRIASSTMPHMDPAILARMSDEQVVQTYDMVAAQTGGETSVARPPPIGQSIRRALSEQEQAALEQVQSMLRPPSNKKIIYGAIGATALIAAGVAIHYFWQKRRR